MPWDSDIDAMVTESSIHHLAQFYNMTIHHYQVPSIGAGRDYLLEVNPHCMNDSVDLTNKIDARWVDTGEFPVHKHSRIIIAHRDVVSLTCVDIC